MGMIQEERVRVCFPTEHAIKVNTLLSSVDNPAYYLTQLLQAGSFGGIKQGSIAQWKESQKMDYCTMVRLASQKEEVTIAKGSDDRDKSDDESRRKERQRQRRRR